MTDLTKDPSTHPANDPLMEERLTRVRDELQRKLEYGRDHFFADAAKAIDELLALRAVPQLPQPAVMTPDYSRFLSDVMTAAGLLSHGKRDKALATSLSEFCVAERMRMDAPCLAAPLQGAEPVSQPYTLPEWLQQAHKLAELHGTSFVVFRHGEEAQCADPAKVIISFTDEGLGHQPAEPQQGDLQIKK